MNSPKNLSIETLRGIAILLVVIGHVIGSAPGRRDGKSIFPIRYVIFMSGSIIFKCHCLLQLQDGFML